LFAVYVARFIGCDDDAPAATAVVVVECSSGEREFGCCRNRGRGGVKEEEMKDLDDEEDEEEEAVFSLFLPMGIF